ncbi:hypothetical protein CO652_08725 [Rhizobium sp. H4]|nr:hypothetical protein CO652_08725 [Rhizobium sp. H4]
MCNATFCRICRFSFELQGIKLIPSLLTDVAFYSASSSALCRGSAAHQAVADARDKPGHDEREVGGVVGSLRDHADPSVVLGGR